MKECEGGCGEVIARDGYVLEGYGKWYEVDTKNNNRVTSVWHTPKRCMELVRCRKGLKPRPATETTLDSWE